MKKLFRKKEKQVLVDFEMNEDQLADLMARINAAQETATESLKFANRIQVIMHLEEIGIFKTREEVLMCTALMYS